MVQRVYRQIKKVDTDATVTIATSKTQVSAIQSALNAFNRELLARHIRTCVVTDIQKGDLDVVDDLVATIQKMMK